MAGPHWLLIIPSLLLFVAFFVLGIFSFFYFNQGIFGSAYQAYQGIGALQTHQQMVKVWDDAKQEFYRKILPEAFERELTPSQKEMAWARTHNKILHQVLYDRREIDKEELDSHSYTFTGTSTLDILAGQPIAPQGLAVPFKSARGR